VVRLVHEKRPKAVQAIYNKDSLVGCPRNDRTSIRSPQTSSLPFLPQHNQDSSFISLTRQTSSSASENCKLIIATLGVVASSGTPSSCEHHAACLTHRWQHITSDTGIRHYPNHVAEVSDSSTNEEVLIRWAVRRRKA